MNARFADADDLAFLLHALRAAYRTNHLGRFHTGRSAFICHVERSRDISLHINGLFDTERFLDFARDDKQTVIESFA